MTSMLALKVNRTFHPLVGRVRLTIAHQLRAIMPAPTQPTIHQAPEGAAHSEPARSGPSAACAG